MYYNIKNHHNNNGDFLMEFDRTKIKIEKNINPISIKENNMNLSILFDNSLKTRKKTEDGFILATKIKRNFK